MSSFLSMMTRARSYALRIEDNRAKGMVSLDGDSYVAFTSNTTLSASEWTHVALVRSGNELSLWIDGEKDENTENAYVLSHMALLGYALGQLYGCLPGVSTRTGQESRSS